MVLSSAAHSPAVLLPIAAESAERNRAQDPSRGYSEWFWREKNGNGKLFPEERNQMALNQQPEVQNNSEVKLTRREVEVLTLVLDGKSPKQVADELYCSKRTIDFHLARIYEKLQVNNRVSAMRRATALGLITIDYHIDIK